MSSSRVLIALAISLSFTGIALAQEKEPQTVVGLVKTKPEKGPFVETKDGFMVPYTMRVPGSRAKFTMIPIAGGSFTQGSPADEEGRSKDEGPMLKVAVKPFWMAKCEVTWREYTVFMNSYDVFKQRESDRGKLVRKLSSAKFRAMTPEKREAFLKSLGEAVGKVVYKDDDRADAVTAPTPLYEPSTTYQKGQDPEDPAVTMSQYAARQYTKWLSLMAGHFYRLPSESEWEYAARAGTKTRFFFGDDPDKMGEYAWYTENSDDEYQHVGKKKPNPWGLHDIYGNVAELVIDQYEADAYARLAKKENLTGTTTIMPATKIFPQVVRGGSWDSAPKDLRSAARFRTEDWWRDSDPNIPMSPWWFTEDPSMCVGFRIIRPLEVPDRETQEKFWAAYSDELKSDITDRVKEGRGIYGLIDPTLPADIKKAGY